MEKKKAILKIESYSTKDGKIFCNVKLYKNGNRHLKFCTDFMKKLNVEMASHVA